MPSIRPPTISELANAAQAEPDISPSPSSKFEFKHYLRNAKHSPSPTRASSQAHIQAQRCGVDVQLQILLGPSRARTEVATVESAGNYSECRPDLPYAQLPRVFLFASRKSPLTVLLLGPGVDNTKLNYIHRSVASLCFPSQPPEKAGRVLFLGAIVHGALWISNHIVLVILASAVCVDCGAYSALDAYLSLPLAPHPFPSTPFFASLPHPSLRPSRPSRCPAAEPQRSVECRLLNARSLAHAIPTSYAIPPPCILLTYTPSPFFRFRQAPALSRSGASAPSYSAASRRCAGGATALFCFLTFPAFFTTICYRTAYAMPWLLPHLPYPLIFLPPRAETPSSPIELSVVPHSLPPRYSSPAFRRSIPSRPHPALLVHTFSRTFHTYSSSFLPLLPILPSIFTHLQVHALIGGRTYEGQPLSYYDDQLSFEADAKVVDATHTAEHNGAALARGADMFPERDAHLILERPGAMFTFGVLDE
ncbi:hypothetical protein DFH09DRAFT_1368053 [Mycena vulgaris]|nr:hypothetical protein DFH09DRAFT_1368053 [Mycena vulgaris]